MKSQLKLANNDSSRAGFSLFELMIVIAILLTLLGLAAPNLMERVRSGRVFEAADDVRDVASSARAYAIEYGIDYHLRYEVGGPAAVAMPAESGPQISNNYSEEATDDRKRLKALILDEDITFNALEGENPGGETLEPKDFDSLEEAADFAQRTWSNPILFRPDGSAQDAQFRVMDEEGRQSEITIRGLTGAVSVTPVFERDDQ